MSSNESNHELFAIEGDVIFSTCEDDMDMSKLAAGTFFTADREHMRQLELMLAEKAGLKVMDIPKNVVYRFTNRYKSDLYVICRGCTMEFTDEIDIAAINMQ